MADDFRYDVFLSHSSRDKAVVRPLAERLRADGLRVWYDEWVLKVGDNIFSKIEEGLEHSRILVFEGERFDVMSIRRWRDRVLSDGETRIASYLNWQTW